MDIRLFHDSTLRAAILELCPCLIPNGQIIAAVEASLSVVMNPDALPPTLRNAELKNWPNLLIRDNENCWWYAVDVAALQGQLTADRCATISRSVGAGTGVVIVNAFSSEREFDAEVYRPWFTSAWFASNPGRIFHIQGATDWHGVSCMWRQSALHVLTDPRVDKCGSLHVHVPSGESAELAYEVQI